MPQKLSAMKYIKNNKRRVSVLIVSLSLYFLMIYLLYFVLSTTIESFRVVLIDGTKKFQTVRLSGDAFLLSDEMEQEEYETEVFERTMILAEELKQQEGISEVFYVQSIPLTISTLVGGYSYWFPLVEAEKIPVMIEHSDAVLKEGRLPEHAGEVILDERTMVNNHYKIGDNIYTEDFTIVGVFECEMYFGCGVKVDKESYNKDQELCVLSDGSIKDMLELIQKIGYPVTEENTYIWDLKRGEQSMWNDVEKEVNDAMKIIYTGVFIILTIALFVVYTTYLRDRYNEWCLYCSIGYSRKTIYFSIIRELLFTFGTALVIGGVLLIISMKGIDYVLISPLGMRRRYFQPDVLVQILCLFVWLFGLLQIPVRYALYKIQTIDAMEDDLY